MKKPKVLGEEYEIRVVRLPPPGPPEYEPVDMWPQTSMPTKQNQGSKAPIIISLIALIIAMLSIFFIIALMLKPFPFQMFPTVVTSETVITTFTQIHPTTTTLKTTVTTERTHTVSTTITVSQVAIRFARDLEIYLNPNFECEGYSIRMFNIIFKDHNETYKLLLFNISVLNDLKIDGKNFSISEKDSQISITELKKHEGIVNYVEYQVAIYYRASEHELTVDFKNLIDGREVLCQIIRLRSLID